MKLWKTFCAQKVWKMDQKWGFFEFIEKFGHYFFLSLFYHEHLLCSCINPILKKNFVPKIIRLHDFWINFISWTNWWNNLINMLTKFKKVKSWSKFFLGGNGQRWVWQVCSWDSKIDFISRMSRCNKLFFSMLVQSLIFGWVWPFSSWDPKICSLKSEFMN